jgi:hypothetical protein
MDFKDVSIKDEIRSFLRPCAQVLFLWVNRKKHQHISLSVMCVFIFTKAYNRSHETQRLPKQKNKKKKEMRYEIFSSVNTPYRNL